MVRARVCHRSTPRPLLSAGRRAYVKRPAAHFACRLSGDQGLACKATTRLQDGEAIAFAPNEAARHRVRPVASANRIVGRTAFMSGGPVSTSAETKPPRKNETYLSN